MHPDWMHAGQAKRQTGSQPSDALKLSRKFDKLHANPPGLLQLPFCEDADPADAQMKVNAGFGQPRTTATSFLGNVAATSTPSKTVFKRYGPHAIQSQMQK